MSELVAALERGDGNPDVFDAEWRTALESGDPRWLSYPAERAATQAELFEHVKARQVDQILAEHGIVSGRVLEYACGSAGMSSYLANRGFDVVAADLSINGLRLAQKNAQLRAVPSTHFAVSIGDVFHLPFADASFDVVMSYGLLEHFTEPVLVELLAETNRVLRPGGLHIVDIIHGRWSIRTFASLLNFAASASASAVRGQSERIPQLYRAYFENYFENTLHPADWARLFEASGLQQVVVQTCRPFPMLAVSGRIERAYVALLKSAMPLWAWFDATQLPGADTLGWMDLVYGVKAHD